jgi:hypothetical protein
VGLQRTLGARHQGQRECLNLFSKQFFKGFLQDPKHIFYNIYASTQMFIEKGF